jgi:DNA recombination protein RmuC
MVIGLLVSIGVFVLVAVVLLVILFLRSGKTDTQVFQPLFEAIGRTEVVVRDELGKSRTDAANASQATRQELGATLMNAFTTINGSISLSVDQANQQSTSLRLELQGMLTSLADALRNQLNELFTTNNNLISAQIQRVEQLAVITGDGLEKIRAGLDENLKKFQQSSVEEAQKDRKEIGDTLGAFSDRLGKIGSDLSTTMTNQFDLFGKQILGLTKTNEEKMEQIRVGVDAKLGLIQKDNESKLELIRKTVDEKLHETLEKRLGESFLLVSQNLEQVQKGLGEMRSLATGVGDLKKVLTNVKTRGIFGEVMLQSLLDQILTPDQYETNVAVDPNSQARVEFAVKLPGQSDGQKQLWLPIDSKFPQEDYQRLQDAYETGNVEQIEAQKKMLEIRIKAEAKSIKDSYLVPPYSTEFGLMFLCTEGLFSETLRIPGLQETLQREYKVVICGPTTLAAILNSLVMGFKAVAISKRSSEVWATLSIVKGEFTKFGDILDKTRKKLDEASNTIDLASKKSRTIEKKLHRIESLPVHGAVSESLVLDVVPDLLALDPEDPEAN